MTVYCVGMLLGVDRRSTLVAWEPGSTSLVSRRSMKAPADVHALLTHASFGAYVVVVYRNGRLAAIKCDLSDADTASSSATASSPTADAVLWSEVASIDGIV